MIRHIKIENYRLFQEFETDSFARVNLVVGNNNSGKSSLLEAIHLLTSNDIRLSLIYILQGRGELASEYLEPRSVNRRNGYQISQIFHDRHMQPGQRATIRTLADAKLTLQILLRRTISSGDGDINQSTLLSGTEEIEGDNHRGDADLLEFIRTDNGAETYTGRLRITEDGVLLDPRLNPRGMIHPKGKSRLLTTNYVGHDELAVLWNNITLTPREDRVVEALQILEPSVDRISFTSNQTANSGILLRLKDELQPVQLGSMGDGMRRIIAIAASLVSVEDGILLVDEIDTGLYHGAQVDMWHLVLETALRQDAQIFATTHSWDCVKAFQQALLRFNKPDIGRLIRLEKSDKKVEAIPYSVDELEIAVKQGIEVR